MKASNTINGKSFEYACLEAIKNKLEQQGKTVTVTDDAAYKTAKKAFDGKPSEEQQTLMSAADTAVTLIFPLEPTLEYGKGEIILGISADAVAQGVDGDVRDVICIRQENSWEIGLSCKHNHEALKHPRITAEMDFGSDWIGHPCSDEFISEMTPIINPLIQMGAEKKEWKDIEDKTESFYVPILVAYINEIRRMCEKYEDTPQRLVSYFFGSRDFYKVIAKVKQGTTTVEAFNMHDTLGKSCAGKKPLTKIRQLHFPTRLIEADFKENSKTTIILIFDGGWTISMRLHNKDKIAKPTSLAWDVQLVGLPTGIYLNTHPWLEEYYKRLC